MAMIMTPKIFDYYMRTKNVVAIDNFDNAIHDLNNDIQNNAICHKRVVLYYRLLYTASVVLAAMCSKLEAALSLHKDSIELKLLSVEISSWDSADLILWYSLENPLLDFETRAGMACSTDAFDTSIEVDDEGDNKFMDCLLYEYDWSLETSKCKYRKSYGLKELYKVLVKTMHEHEGDYSWS